MVEIEGARNYYKRISDIYQSAKSDEEIIALHDIDVSDTDNRIVRVMKKSVLGNSMLGNNRLGKNIINRIYIEDMYLYRMDWKKLNSINIEYNEKSSSNCQINTI